MYMAIYVSKERFIRIEFRVHLHMYLAVLESALGLISFFMKPPSIHSEERFLEIELWIWLSSACKLISKRLNWAREHHLLQCCYADDSAGGVTCVCSCVRVFVTCVCSCVRVIVCMTALNSTAANMWGRRRGGGLGSRPKKMYGERLEDGVEYHLMSPTPRR